MAKKGNKVKVRGLDGMTDVSPKDTCLWRTVWDAGNRVARLHHFHYVETPVVERAELFEKAFGSNGDSAENKLFTFKAGTRTKMALRPEGCPAVLRSYLENQLGYFSLPLKAYYSGPAFIKGGRDKKSQFHEWGFQVIGDSDPIYDVQVVFAILNLLENLRISEPVLKVNAVGCRVCRPGFREKIKRHYRSEKKDFCENCRTSYNRDPITLFRCESKKCAEVRQEAPNILDNLCQSCNNHFQNILELIEDNGVDYVSDPYFFGNKGYYSKFVFEVYPDRDMEFPIASGGRHDYLSEIIGGRQLPSTGGVIYLDDLVDYLKKKEAERDMDDGRDRLFFIAVGKEARKASLSLMNDFRKRGIVVVEHLGRKTLESQLKAADRNGAQLILIYGQKEVFEGTAVVREVVSGIQESIPLEGVFERVKEKMRRLAKSN